MTMEGLDGSEGGRQQLEESPLDSVIRERLSEDMTLDLNNENGPARPRDGKRLFGIGTSYM